MQCIVCSRGKDERELFEGIFEDGIVIVCAVCAEEEGIPMIRKPSVEQLEKADEHHSVRERMERLSGMSRRTVRPNQSLVQGTWAKLRHPDKKESHEDVHDNYYWEVGMARRRRKMTPTQLGKLVGYERQLIQDIEKGKIPENFKEIFPKLERILNIKLLKKHEPIINFNRLNRDQEKEILESVRMKMKEPQDEEDELIDELELIDRKENPNNISKVELDFHKQKNLRDVTLNELVERKHKRDKIERIRKEDAKTNSMIGDDIDLEIEEL